MSGYGYEPRIRTLVPGNFYGYADTNPLRNIGSYPPRLRDGFLSSHPQTTGCADRLVPPRRQAPTPVLEIRFPLQQFFLQVAESQRSFQHPQSLSGKSVRLMTETLAGGT